jgi:hypothetical protein
LHQQPLPLPVQATPTGAYEMYVLGIDAMRAKTPDSVERARRYFTQGFDLDPQYARNYAGLASSWIVQSEVGGRIGTGEGYARAEPLYAVVAARSEAGRRQARTRQRRALLPALR